MTRVQSLEQHARHAAEVGRDADADVLYRQLRAELTDKDRSLAPYVAQQHAIVLGRLGRDEEAIGALEQAVAGGETNLELFTDDPKLARLSADPRVRELVAKAAEAAQRFDREWRDAMRLVDPRSVPAFESLAALKAALVKEAPLETASWPERGRFAKRQIATTQRYVDEHPDAADRERAWLEELRCRVESDFGFSETSYASAGAALRERSLAFALAFPKSEARREATLYAAIGAARGVNPDDYDWRHDAPLRPKWRNVLAELESLANGDPATDKWAAAALGHLTLARFDAGQLDAARATAKRFLDLPEPDWSDRTPFHSRLRTENKVVSWKIDGLPPVTAKRLDGTTVDLSKLGGKITLIDFWSPG